MNTKNFELAGKETVSLYIDRGDWDGAVIALSSLQKDIELVTGKKIKLVNDTKELYGTALIAGSVEKSEIIKQLAASRKIDISSIEGKWESYICTVVENPIYGVDKALVIAGSDKRGTIYGIYRISELAGVSPWVWWADSTPYKTGAVTLENVEVIQLEPSVKYRGIFLNDESPSLSSWVKRFGRVCNKKANQGFNSSMYANVFELILRLKGNYLWPAMWNNAFGSDDPQNLELATKYGIVMGTSHHEPMDRADKEWNWSGKGEWNYYTNRDNIYDFWDKGVKERTKYESIITIGMRGQNDTSMLPEGSSIAENIKLLNTIISDQRKIIKEAYGSENKTPQVWALYKEVEDYYYGEGMIVPEDVTLLLCDDNFGNTRTLPVEKNRNHPGGFGMYYHFDYVGGPVSYKWVNTVPLTKICEQMSIAYDSGIRRIWIVNTGDLKPMELPIDYFLNLAYDYDKWSEPKMVWQFTYEWCRREFGTEFAKDVAEILSAYTKLNGARKPEVVSFSPPTYSLYNYDEAERVLNAYKEVSEKAEKLYSSLPDIKKDAFYQLVLYPARASYNVVKYNICAAWYIEYANESLPAGNTYANLARKAFEADKEDRDYYNNTLTGGKWSGIMTQNHIGYKMWSSATIVPEYDVMMDFIKIPPSKTSELTVRMQGSSSFIKSGEAELPLFTSINDEQYYIDIFNCGNTALGYNIKSNAGWIILGKTSGSCNKHEKIYVSVDWSKLPYVSESSTITISGGGSKVTVKVTANTYAISDISSNTYIETHGYISINPANYAAAAKGLDGAKWTVLEDYGRLYDSVKVLPNSHTIYKCSDDAPYLLYKLYIHTAGIYKLSVCIAPTNNHFHRSVCSPDEQLRFCASFDGGLPVTAKTLPENYAVANGNYTWETGVLTNSRIVDVTEADLSIGEHELRIYAKDSGVVIQQILLAQPKSKYFANSYFGPPESFLKI